VGGEAFKSGAVVGVERTALEATDGDRGCELAVEEDRDTDQRSQSDVADRRNGRGIRGVVVDGDGRPGAQDRADDPQLGRRVEPHDPLAGTGACRDVELVAAADVDGGVVRIRAIVRKSAPGSVSDAIWVARRSRVLPRRRAFSARDCSAR